MDWDALPHPSFLEQDAIWTSALLPPNKTAQASDGRPGSELYEAQILSSLSQFKFRPLID
jgi:hypothetical protein